MRRVLQSTSRGVLPLPDGDGYGRSNCIGRQCTSDISDISPLVARTSTTSRARRFKAREKNIEPLSKIMGDKEPSKRRRTTCKTGCRTCKTRKVKCDEGRPACHRCISTGRVCEGYGIWGGGNDHMGDGSGARRNYSENRRTAAALRLPPRIPSTAGSSEELQLLEWFQCRTIQKIPGLFSLSFWAEFTLKAGATEPAIFSAIIALSLSHKQLVQGYDAKSDDLALQQYVKAIDKLRPHFMSRDHASVRVALVACVLFVCLELLRGNFQFAQKHLKAGLLILHEWKSADVRAGVLNLCHGQDSTDRWIVEAFSRLHLQVELFHQTFSHPVLPLALPCCFTEFRTINAAWYNLERLFHRILHLIDKFRIRGSLEEPELNERTGLIAELAAWKSTYTLSKSHLDSVERSGTAHHLLSEYYIMAVVMCETSSRRDEEAFEKQIGQFKSILEHSISLYNARFSRHGHGWPLLDDRHFGMANSMVDMGWIPPLYYTAIKCRVRRIRLHAIRLLECASHREGIWDSRVTARIARTVVELEEGVPLAEMGPHFDLETVPTQDDTVFSITVPFEKRLREVRVLLEDELIVKLWYRRGDGPWEFV